MKKLTALRLAPASMVAERIMLLVKALEGHSDDGAITDLCADIADACENLNEKLNEICG